MRLQWTCIILLLAVPIFAQPKNSNSVSQIDKYVRSVDKVSQTQKEPDLVVANISGYDKKGKWRSFKSSKDLEKFRETTETYTIANNWRINGKIVASVFTLFSQSGDWAEYVTHYFRADGTVAKVTSELRTFYGDYLVLREFYFDARGNRLKKSTRYLDLKTEKPKKPNPDLFGDNPMLSRTNHYKKVSALPFYSLVRPKI